MGMRNIAKKRAPTAVVPVAMALPTAATIMRQIIWMDLSLTLADVHVTQTDNRKVAN